MARTQITIGNRIFKTKKAAMEHFKYALKHAPLGTVRDLELDSALCDLVNRHPNSSAKIGTGILRFYVHDNNGFGGKGFGIDRLDGTSCIFSYKKCIHGKDHEDYEKFILACRSAVSRDCWLAKQRHFEELERRGVEIVCEISGRVLSRDEAQLDHIPPLSFNVIAHCFRSAHPNLFVSGDCISESTANSIGYTFSNQETEQMFRDYHRIVTKGHLRIVGNRENSSQSHRGRLPKTTSAIPIVINKIS